MTPSRQLRLRPQPRRYRSSSQPRATRSGTASSPASTAPVATSPVSASSQRNLALSSLGIAGAALVMVTNLSFPAKTVPEFIAYAKANPGKINMAVAGGGASTPFLAGALFKGMTGVESVWVQYRGEYVPDLISGQVQAAFTVIPRADSG